MEKKRAINYGVRELQQRAMADHLMDYSQLSQLAVNAGVENRTKNIAEWWRNEGYSQIQITIDGTRVVRYVKLNDNTQKR